MASAGLCEIGGGLESTYCLYCNELQGFNNDMKIRQKIYFVLLLTTFSSAYAGSCFEELYDIDDCRVKAEQGDARAQFLLAVEYDKGQGVTQDDKAAVKWYRKAAEQGVDSAQYNLALMYYNGQGVLQDYVMAHMYFNISAVSGNKNAIKGRGIVEKQMAPSQIAEAQKLAREWVQAH